MRGVWRDELLLANVHQDAHSAVRCVFTFFVASQLEDAVRGMVICSKDRRICRIARHRGRDTLGCNDGTSDVRMRSIRRRLVYSC